MRQFVTIEGPTKSETREGVLHKFTVKLPLREIPTGWRRELAATQEDRVLVEVCLRDSEMPAAEEGTTAEDAALAKASILLRAAESIFREGTIWGDSRNSRR